MNKDQIKGRVKEAEGTIKQVTGKIVGNENLEEKGRVEKVAGTVQAGYGDIKSDIKSDLKKVD